MAKALTEAIEAFGNALPDLGESVLSDEGRQMLAVASAQSLAVALEELFAARDALIAHSPMPPDLEVQ
jgi:hypothetical protein